MRSLVSRTGGRAPSFPTRRNLHGNQNLTSDTGNIHVISGRRQLHPMKDKRCCEFLFPEVGGLLQLDRLEPHRPEVEA